jgi:predicted negative regulator of RcsB-dependent stress response
MLGSFNIFTQLDPLLQALAVIALIAFVFIVGFRLWPYVQKRRMRKRADLWVHY